MDTVREFGFDTGKIKAFSGYYTDTAKLRASSLLLCNSPVKSGTKATFNVPSAKSERNKLGKRRATKKASAIILAPRKRAIRISRTKPTNLLMAVPPLTVAILFNKLMFSTIYLKKMRCKQKKFLLFDKNNVIISTFVT